MSIQWTGLGDHDLGSLFSQFDLTDPRMQSVPGLSAALRDPCHALVKLEKHVTFLAEECNSIEGTSNYYKVRTNNC